MKTTIFKAIIAMAAIFGSKTMATEHGYWTPDLIVAVSNGNIQVRFTENATVWYTVFASTTNIATNVGMANIYTMLLDAYNNGRKIDFDETSNVINWARIEVGH